MRSFFNFFAKRQLFANLVTLSIIALGLLTLPNIKRDMFPRVDLGEVVITTRYDGAAPKDVELFVTNKLEKELKGIDGVTDMSSSSTEELSTIRLKIDLSVKDMDKVKRKIREAIDNTRDLPENSDPYIYEVESANFPILDISIYGDIPYKELYEIAKRFERKLENINGVANLNSFGFQAREIQVEVDGKKLEQYQVSLRDIDLAIKTRNKRASMGKFEGENAERNIVTNAQFSEPMEVGDVILRSNFTKQVIRIKDLAIIKDAFEKESELTKVNGKRGISFMVFKSENADIIDTTKRIDALIEDEREYLPKNVYISKLDDISFYIKNRLKVMVSNGFLGLALVLIVLSLFLNIRMAFWVAMGIPVAVLGTIFVLASQGYTLNIISLMSLIIVIGIIVDDGIIIAENISQKRDEGLSPIDAATEGITSVFKPVLTTIVTTFIAFLPFFFMPGIMGRFVFIIPVVITLALFFSLIEICIALPAHIVPSLNKERKESRIDQKRRQFLKFLRVRYKKFLKKCLRKRYKIAVIFLLLLILCLSYASYFLKFVLFSKEIADKFVIQIEYPVNYSLRQNYTSTSPVESVLLSLNKKELLGFNTRVGMKGNSNYMSEKKNHSSIFVNLKPSAERKRTAQEIVDDLREKTSKLETDGTIRYLIEGGGPPVGREIAVKVIGDNNVLRDKLTNEVYAFLSKLKGVSDLKRNDESENNQLELQINYEKAAQLGINIQDIIQVFRTAYTGSKSTTVRYGNDDIDFKVILAVDQRQSRDSLNSLSIPNRNNRLIKIKDIATIKEAPGNPNIYHFNTERSISIDGDVDEKVITSKEVSDKLLANFNINKDWPGMTLKLGGESEETNKSIQDLNKSFLAAIFGIFLVLILLFNSILQPFLVLTAIPFAIMGVIIAFGLHQENLGFLASIGTVGLCGVVVNDSLVMVNHINVLRRQNKRRKVLEVVLQGASERFRPIVLTSLTTISGLLPLAYGIGGADPFIAPMALALGYGLFFATPLILFFLPCFYMILYDLRTKLAKRKILKPFD